VSAPISATSRINTRAWIPETPLSNTRVIIVASGEESGARAADRLRDALAPFGSLVQVLHDPAHDVLLAADGPVFLLGNLANSQCVRYLYYRLLSATDRRYPGPAGYELRTLADPFATGANIVHLGYSDDAGLEAGLRALQGMLRDPLPFCREIHATRLPLPDNEVDEFLHTPMPLLDWQISNGVLIDQKGYLAYLTGNTDLLDEYCRAWQAVISCGIEASEKIVQTHLYMLSRITTWRLLEGTGMIPETMCAPILQFMLDWARSNEAVPLLSHTPYQSPYVPRQNHGLIPALALTYLAEHCTRHYPQVTEAVEWLQVANRVFAPYGKSWKPICDGLCHGWWLSQPVMLHYGLFDPEHRYFEEGGARIAADCAQAVVNNQGWMPSAGDADLLRQFPGPTLRIAAAYYQDPTYLATFTQAADYRRNKWLGGTPLTRTFDIGLDPVPPNHASITVVPMDALVYHTWERNAPDRAAMVCDTPPNSPLERCFDKIALRAGNDVDDDYLLVDGLGGGSHSYADAAAVLDYARFGVSCLVSEDALIFTAPEHHTAVTVVRDGVVGKVPAFAELEEQAVRADGTLYLRIRLTAYAGAEWVREIFLLPGRCAVFHDTVTARVAGDYAIEAHFRTPARAVLDGGNFVSRRESRTGGAVEFRLQSLCEPQHVRLEALPIDLLYRHLAGDPPTSPESDSVEAWRRRYGTDDIALTQYTARAACHLRAGETVILTHLAQIRGLSEPALTLRAEDGVLVVGGDGEIILPVHVDASPAVKCVGHAPALAALTYQPLAECPSPVSSLASAGGLLLAGTLDGALCALDAGGGIVWKALLAGPIRDIATLGQPAAPFTVVGHGDDLLTALDDDGRVLWQRTIEREPCPWPWWELRTPAPAQVAGSIVHGEALFAVGCGDIQVRLFDAGGALRSMWRYNEGVPGRLRVADVNGDGEPEIIVGGDLFSDQSTCRILDRQLRVKAELPVEGWTSCLTAVAWECIDGRHLVACGASRGRNLLVYDLDQPGEPAAILEARLGGEVRGLCFDQRSRALLAGTSQGFLLVFGLDGSRRFVWLLPSGVKTIIPWHEAFLVTDITGYSRLVTADGRQHAAGAGTGGWTCWTAHSGTVVFAADRGIFSIEYGGMS